MKEHPHKYEVELSPDQRFILQQLIAKGKAPARQQAHARIVLKIDRNAPGPRLPGRASSRGLRNEPLHGDAYP